jgi:hypothetical protein
MTAGVNRRFARRSPRSGPAPTVEALDVEMEIKGVKSGLIVTLPRFAAPGATVRDRSPTGPGPVLPAAYGCW